MTGSDDRPDPSPPAPDSESADLCGDAELAERAGAGDGAAFAELFERHFPPSLRFATQLMWGDDAAQDAVQNAWLKAWLCLADFRGEAQFRTWLFSIVRHEVVDVHRRRQRSSTGEDALVAELARSPSHGPEQSAIDRESWASLVATVGRLPANQRECWASRELEGHSYQETARALGVSTTVVRGRLHRARHSLALTLTDRQGA